MLLNGSDNPLKLPLPLWPTHVSPKTEFWSVQPFLQGSRTWPRTHKPTTLCSSSPHRKRPNNFLGRLKCGRSVVGVCVCLSVTLRTECASDRRTDRQNASHDGACCCMSSWLRCIVVRTLVFDRRTFPVPRSTCSWRVTTYVGEPSAIWSAN